MISSSGKFECVRSLSDFSNGFYKSDCLLIYVVSSCNLSISVSFSIVSMYATHIAKSLSLSLNLCTWFIILTMMLFDCVMTEASYLSLICFRSIVNSESSTISSNLLLTFENSCSVRKKMAVLTYYRRAVIMTDYLLFGLTIRKQIAPIKPDVNNMARYLILLTSNSVFTSFFIFVFSKVSSYPKNRLNSLEKARLSIR